MQAQKKRSKAGAEMKDFNQRNLSDDRTRGEGRKERTQTQGRVLSSWETDGGSPNSSCVKS